MAYTRKTIKINEIYQKKVFGRGNTKRGAAWIVLLIFLLELQIFVVAAQKIHKNSIRFYDYDFKQCKHKKPQHFNCVRMKPRDRIMYLSVMYV